MSRSYRIASVGTLLIVLSLSAYALTVSGKVVDIADNPIAGAELSLAVNGGSTTSDGDGNFSLTAGSAVLHGFDRAAPIGVVFGARKVSFQTHGSGRVAFSLFDGGGRRVRHQVKECTGRRRIDLDIQGRTPLAQGMYYARLAFPGHVVHNRLVVLQGACRWERTRMRAGNDFGHVLAKRLAVLDTVKAGKSGYRSGVLLVTDETMNDVVIRLYPEGVTIPTEVTVVETTVSMEVTIALRTKDLNSGDGIYGSKGFGWQTDYDPGTRTITRDVSMIILDNGLVRVTVSPSLGMRVVQARDLTLGKDMFFNYDPVHGSRVWDVGGIEASWPFFEHGLHITATESPIGFQSGGYRIVREADGGVTLAMNMQFTEYQDSSDSGIHGRYSDRPLSSWVTLRPGTNRFTVSYRADNPNPTRRNDRIWNDAFFKKGTDEAVIVVPARWAVHHFCNEIFDMAGDFNGKPWLEWEDDTPYRKRSIFALNDRYPFVGVHYPSESVNRVRTHDPETAPGIKVYIQGALDFIEIWGSTGVVFEEPGDFVDAYHPARFSNSYFMTRDIGTLSYANDDVAIGVDTIGHVFKLTATKMYDVVVEDFDGNELATGRIGPALPVLAGSCPDNRIVVKTPGGAELMRQSFPLELPDNLHPWYDSLYASCIRSYTGSGNYARIPDSDNLGGDKDSRRGFNYELEGLQNNTDALRGYHGLSAAEAVSADDDPAYIMSVARVCHRYGCLDKAAELCDLVTEGDHAAEAVYLKGLIAWERGEEAVDFTGAGTQANYHKALRALQSGSTETAISLLEEYVAAFPEGYRPALALAYLNRDLSAARALAARNPGSPEAVWVLDELGEPGAQTDLGSLVTNNPGAQDAVDRFRDEVTGGTWVRVPLWEPFPSIGCSHPGALR
jgi:hypothetical protein